MSKKKTRTKLPPERRSEIGRAAAKARWAKSQPSREAKQVPPRNALAVGLAAMRTAKLSPERRSEIAKIAAEARWGKKSEKAPGK
jgi:hypothetical protein